MPKRSIAFEINKRLKEKKEKKLPDLLNGGVKTREAMKIGLAV